MGPAIWIQGLENLRRRLEILGHKISEMDVIIHIIHNLLQGYETIVELLENELEMQTATLERVRERPRTKFERSSMQSMRMKRPWLSFQKNKWN